MSNVLTMNKDLVDATGRPISVPKVEEVKAEQIVTEEFIDTVFNSINDDDYLSAGFDMNLPHPKLILPPTSFSTPI